MIKIVDVCKRIEGHGNLKMYIKDDRIVDAEFQLPIYRGFENILKGKKILDVPRIVSRICGLCHASQTIVSCKAIENIYNIKPTQQAIFLRRLLMLSELLKSHITHFFFQSLPDLLKIFNITSKDLDLNHLLVYNQDLTKNVFELIKISDEISRSIGGRSVHLINILPGGIIFKPGSNISKLIQNYISKGLIAIRGIIEYFINKFSKHAPPNYYNLPQINYMALNNNTTYDRYDGQFRIIKNPTKYEDFSPKDFNNYFDKDIGLRGINFYGEGKNNTLVGPIARKKIGRNFGFNEIDNYFSSFEKGWNRNLLYANFFRLIEIYYELKYIEQTLDLKLLNSFIPLPDIQAIRHFTGIGAVEAPRGSLLHYYKVDKRNVVEEAKFFIATEINLPIINKMIIKYARELYKTMDISIVKKKVQMMIRSFDPCISCATH
ncbi:MAG: nickel-dependent hydrogenase large subunit [Promethearchaeota archaeon]